jgi:hypothetical protein
MVLLGCKPQGRNTEQHDVFFGVAEKLRDLIPQMRAFWPGEHKLHIDVWSKIEQVGSHHIEILQKENNSKSELSDNLYFINLGGYKVDEFEEYHEKHLFCGKTMSEAIAWVKETPFYIDGQKLEKEIVDPRSHIDDQEIIDDILNVADVIPNFKEKYILYMKGYSSITRYPKAHIGYLKFSLLEKLDI